MIINTRDFGHVEISQEDIIYFPEGIYGFENTKEFVILKIDDETQFYCLQAVNEVYPRLVITNPEIIMPGYSPAIGKEILDKLGAKSPLELRFFVVAVIPANIRDITVNLKSPIVLNIRKNIAMQVVLDNTDYKIRHRIFSESEGG